MLEEWKKQIADWEDEIRAGHGGLVRLALVNLKRTEIPRECLCQIVNLSRRTRLERWGMKLLFPYVRVDESNKGASAQEICEYSSALMEMGSLDEAKALLSAVDPKEESRALLYLAFLCFRNWDGVGARHYLDTYLAHEMDDYSRLVGEVNLAAALVQTHELEDAKRLLAHLEESARNQEKKMLLGNILELRSQIAVQEKDWERANRDLEQSALLLQASHHDSLLFTLKWQAVVGLHQGNPEAPRRIGEVQQKARRMRLWETVRDCDRHLAVHQVREDLFNRLYFGSPFKAFREILLREYPEPSHLREHYDWIGGKEGKNWKVLVDLGSWEGEGLPHHLRPGHLVHSLVMVLSADLYSPQKMGTLFGALFPGEHFNPHSSPEKVYKVIQRSREWFEGSGLGLSVEQNAGFYRLRVLAGTAVRLHCRMKDSIAKPDKIAHLGEYLIRQFGENRFSAKQLSEHLSVSQRTANRLLKEAQENGWVEKTGKGPSTRFQVKSKKAA